MAGALETESTSTVLFAWAIVAAGIVSEEQLHHKITGTLSMLISFCTAETASFPSHLLSSMISCICMSWCTLLNLFIRYV